MRCVVCGRLLGPANRSGICSCCRERGRICRICGRASSRSFCRDCMQLASAADRGLHLKTKLAELAGCAANAAAFASRQARVRYYRLRAALELPLFEGV